MMAARWRRCAAAVLVILSSRAVASGQGVMPVPMSERRAVELALDYNLGLAAIRVDAQVSDVELARTKAAWTPELRSTVSSTHANAPSASLLTGAQARASDAAQATQIGLAQRLPFGTEYRLTWDTTNITTNNLFTRFNPQVTSALSIEVAQPLIRGLRIDSERAQTAIALVGQRRAEAQVEAAVAATRRRAGHAYWQWVHASEVLSVERESLRLAQELLEQNRQRVATGAMAAVDLIEAEAEVARRDEAILIWSKNARNAEDVLRRVIFDPASEMFTAPLQRVAEEDAPPKPKVDTPDLGARLDVRLAQTAVDVEKVNVRLFRNDTRPDVTLRINYTAQSVGGDELLRAAGFPGAVVATAPRSFSSTLGDLAAGRYPTWTAQLSMSYPIGTSQAAATLAGAMLLERRNQTAVADAKLAANTEATLVRREVETNLQRLASTQTAVDLALRRLGGEQRKFTAGLSTSFFVFQAQRDLAQARQAALRALLDYRLARADLDAVPFIPLGFDQPIDR